jgi:hypothetical protein
MKHLGGTAFVAYRWLCYEIGIMYHNVHELLHILIGVCMVEMDCMVGNLTGCIICPARHQYHNTRTDKCDIFVLCYQLRLSTGYFCHGGYVCSVSAVGSFFCGENILR